MIHEAARFDLARLTPSEWGALPARWYAEARAVARAIEEERAASRAEAALASRPWAEPVGRVG